MSADQEAAVAAAREQVEEIVRETADRIAEIRQEVLDTVGVEILDEPMAAPSAMDVPLGDLAELAIRCHHLLAAVELLSPHVQCGETRTVGAAVKAGVDLATGAMALHYLRQSNFFAAEEGS